MFYSRYTFAAFASAAGGLLGATVAPAAVAYADTPAIDPAAYSYDLDGKETITSLYNMTTAPPGINESIQGYGLFNALDSSGANDGSFYAYSSTAPYLTPYLSDANSAIVSSQVLYVDSDVPGLHEIGANALPDGSIISITHSGGGAFEAVYSAIPGVGDAPDTVNETLITPFGNIDLTNLVVGLGFDAANVTPQLPDGFTALTDPTVTAVNGLPPLTIAEQGYQTLVYGGQDLKVLETTTEDGLGFHTEAFLVTDSSNASIPDGSVYNVINYGDLSNVYSSTPGADGTVSDILYRVGTDGSETKVADLTSLFADDNASAGLLDGSNIKDIDFGTTTVSPTADAQEIFTGINGLAPGNTSIQGVDTFNYADGANSTTFTGDVTTVPDLSYSHYTETVLVTASADQTVLPDGSIFDVTTYGNGFESIYSDIPGAGTGGNDLITDYLVTPFGNEINLSPFYQTIDASEGMHGTGAVANFFDAAWLDMFPAQGADIGSAAASVAPELGGHLSEMFTNFLSLF